MQREVRGIGSPTDNLEDCKYGFSLAKAQVRYVFGDLDLRPMGMFEVITSTGLVGPDDPLGVGDIEQFLNAENEEEDINNNVN